MVLDLKDGSAQIKDECAGEEQRSTEKGPWCLCLGK